MMKKPVAPTRRPCVDSKDVRDVSVQRDDASLQCSWTFKHANSVDAESMDITYRAVIACVTWGKCDIFLFGDCAKFCNLWIFPDANGNPKTCWEPSIAWQDTWVITA